MQKIGFLVALSLTVTVWAKGEMNSFQKQELVYWHNKARRIYAKKGWCANMLEMEWVPTLASAAVDNVCPVAHNGRVRKAFGRYIGENLAWANSYSCSNGGLCAEAGVCGKQGAPACDPCDRYCSIKNMVYTGWYVEETEDGTTNTKCAEGHCTQNVWQKSSGVGCARHDACTEPRKGKVYKIALNCNYDPPGNTGSDSCATGAACSKCPSTHPVCNDGLCSKRAATSPAPAPAPAPLTKRPTKGPTKRPTPRPTTTSTTGSTDKYRECASWKRAGYCTQTRYRDWLERNCAATCKPTAVECARWGRAGRCTNTRHKTYMERNCFDTCDTNRVAASKGEEALVDDGEVISSNFSPGAPPGAPDGSDASSMSAASKSRARHGLLLVFLNLVALVLDFVH